jgi:hypothetical protein
VNHQQHSTPWGAPASRTGGAVKSRDPNRSMHPREARVEFRATPARTARAIRHLLTVEETAATRGHAALAALAGRKAAQAMAQLAARRARFDRTDPRSIW